MDAPTTRLVATGVLFVLIFLSGYSLGKRGRPYSSAVLTVHKLISLAAAILIALAVYQMNREAALDVTAIVAAAATGALFASTIATGGLLSTDKALPVAVLRVHQIGPFLTVLSSALTLYLVHGR